MGLTLSLDTQNEKIQKLLLFSQKNGNLGFIDFNIDSFYFLAIVNSIYRVRCDFMCIANLAETAVCESCFSGLTRRLVVLDPIFSHHSQSLTKLLKIL